MISHTAKPVMNLAGVAPTGRAIFGDRLPSRNAGSAMAGQSALVVALLLGFLIIPLGLGLFEWRMQQVTYTTLQTAARAAARDGAGVFATNTLQAGTPQLNAQEVARAVQQSLATNLRATLPEVSASDADAAAREAAAQGLTITGVTVCVTVVAPVHFVTQLEHVWTYSARACAHTLVPRGGP